jgi:uncharacterized protein YegL
MPTDLLGGAAPQRDLHFIFLADCSGSMAGEKIAALNAGIEGAIGPMRQVVASHADVRVLVRAIRFSDKANWHVAQETPLDLFTWPELAAGGTTATGEAILLAIAALDKLAGRQYPPVLVLVSDGQATDEVTPALSALASHKWGKRAVRRAVAIGDDADLAALQAFIGDPEIQPTLASRPEDIADAMRFVSVGSLSKASVGKDAVTPSTGTPVVQVPGASSSGQSGSMPPSVF